MEAILPSLRYKLLISLDIIGRRKRHFEARMNDRFGRQQQHYQRRHRERAKGERRAIDHNADEHDSDHDEGTLGRNLCTRKQKVDPWQDHILIRPSKRWPAS